ESQNDHTFTDKRATAPLPISIPLGWHDRVQQRVDADTMRRQFANQRIEQEWHIVIDDDQDCLVALTAVPAGRLKRQNLDQRLASLALGALFEGKFSQRRQRLRRVSCDIVRRCATIKRGKEAL